MSKILEGFLSAKGKKFALVVSRFNELISTKLVEGALDCLKRHDADEKNITIVMVSHDLSLIPMKCSRVVVLDKGRIIMEGKRKDILSSDTIASIFHKEDKNL